MKKNLFLILLVLLLSSCGSSGSGSSGTAPSLANVVPVLYNSAIDDYEITYSFSNGDYWNLIMSASDPDLDITSAEITFFRGDEIFEGPDTVLLPTQSEESMVYFFIEDPYLSDTPLDSYRIRVKMIDAQGNSSREFFVNVVVN